MASDVENAWAAGFLDGEGCFTIYGRSDHYTMRGRVTASQAKHRQPIDKLKGLYGGRIHENSKPTVTGKTTYVWTVDCASDLVVVLPQLIPFLIVKRAQAEILYEFARRADGHKLGAALNPFEKLHRQDLASRIKELKQ